MRRSTKTAFKIGAVAVLILAVINAVRSFFKSKKTLALSSGSYGELKQPSAWTLFWFKAQMRMACAKYGAMGRESYLYAQAIVESNRMTAETFWRDVNPWGMTLPAKFNEGGRTINLPGGGTLERATYGSLYDATCSRLEWDMSKGLLQNSYQVPEEYFRAVCWAGYLGDVSDEVREQYVQACSTIWRGNTSVLGQLLSDAFMPARIMQYWSNKVADILPDWLGSYETRRKMIGASLSIFFVLILLWIIGKLLTGLVPSLARSRTVVREVKIKKVPVVVREHFSSTTGYN